MTWKTAWACAHRATCFTQWNQNSFSYTVRNNLHGTAIRLSFSNWYGFNKCEIKSVVITNNNIEHVILVKGMKTFCVEPKGFANIYSDSCYFPVVPGKIKITVVFEKSDLPGSGQTFMTPPGVVMILQSVEVLSDKNPKVVTVLGDSIAHWGKWTDKVQCSLYEKYPGKLSFFEMSINGSRLLNNSPKQWKNCWGYKAIDRLEHDIFQLSGLTHCIFGLGLNDLCIEETLEDVKLSLDTYIGAAIRIYEKLRQNHVFVIAVTILPRIYDEVYDSGRNELRKQINRWLIEDSPFDLVIDLASVVRNQSDNKLQERYEYEDGCHINDLAGEEIARIVCDRLNKTIDL